MKLAEVSSMRQWASDIQQEEDAIDAGKDSILEHTEAIESLEVQLIEAAKDAGVCSNCGGLLDHEECTV